MGGEKNKELEGVWLPMGSPPRRRGKVVHCAAVRALRGITPRVGGEKIIWASVSIAALESPPHGRGKGVVEGGHVEVNRITPAWAGKRHTGRRCRGLGWDHPRAGGEKVRPFLRMILG